MANLRRQIAAGLAVVLVICAACGAQPQMRQPVPPPMTAPPRPSTDWIKKNIGGVTTVQFSADRGGSVYAGTELGVVASLSKQSGSVEWRHGVSGATERVVQLLLQAGERTLVAVSTTHVGETYLRAFATADGALLWQDQICAANSTRIGQVVLFAGMHLGVLGCENEVEIRNMRDGRAIAAVEECVSHEQFVGIGTWPPSDNTVGLALIGYNTQTNYTVTAKAAFADDMRPATGKLSILPLVDRKEFDDVDACSRVPLTKVADATFACSAAEQVLVFDVLGQEASVITDFGGSYMLSTAYPLPTDSFTMRDSGGAVILVDLKTLRLTALQVPLIENELCSSPKVVLVSTVVEQKDLKVNARRRVGSTVERGGEIVIEAPTSLAGHMTECYVDDATQSVLSVTDSGDVIFSSYDDNEPIIRWMREEALAYIAQAAFVEVESSTKEEELATVGAESLITLLQQKLVDSALFNPETSDSEMIVVAVSNLGKAFGISTTDGRVVWSKQISAPRHTPKFKIFKMGGHKIAIMVVTSWRSDVRFWDALDGSEWQESFTERYGFVNGIAGNESVALFSPDGLNKVVPEEAAFDLERLHWVTTGDDGKLINGYRGGYSIRGGWQLSAPSGEHFSAFSEIPTEGKFLASAARATGDRNVLHKYVNRAAFGAITEPDGDGRGVTTYLVDGFDGSVIHSAHHVNGTGPVSILRCENWLVYSFWDAGFMEQTMFVTDFYEHNEGWVLRSLTSALSGVFGGNQLWEEDSLETDAARPVFHFRKGFLVDARVGSLSVTTTTHAVTMRSILAVMDDSRLVSIPKALLEPRRPVKATPDDKNEMLMPYEPGLSLTLQTQYVSKEHVILGLKGAFTAPVKHRESSSHVLAVGVDIYHTILSPAGKFDALTDDYNYRGVLIGVVSIGVVTMTLRALSSRTHFRRMYMA